MGDVMSEVIVIDVDCVTGETTERAMTPDEAAAKAASDAAEAVAAVAQEAARAALLASTERLAALKAIGWAGLSAAERTEAQALMLEVA